MDALTAAIAFPVLGFTRTRGHYFGAETLDVLTHPRRAMLESGKLPGAELVDAKGARYRVSGVQVTGRRLRTRKRAFVQVALELEPVGQTTFDEVRARIVSDIKRSGGYGGVRDRLEDLAIVQTADSLEQLLSWCGGKEFKGHGRRYWYRAHMGRAPDAPFDDVALGPPVALEQADLAWPIMGIPPRPRSLATLYASDGVKDFTHPYATELKPAKRMELIDSRWRRFRIVETKPAGPTVWGALRVLFGKLFGSRVPMTYKLEPLPSTSMEETRARLLEMFSEDPTGWTLSWGSQTHRRERSRLEQAQSLQQMAGGIFGTPLWKADLPTARELQWKANTDRTNRARNSQARRWLVGMYGVEIAAIAVILTFASAVGPAMIGCALPLGLVWIGAYGRALWVNEANWLSYTLTPGLLVAVWMCLYGWFTLFPAAPH